MMMVGLSTEAVDGFTVIAAQNIDNLLIDQALK
jgi:hypothetical protein